VSWCLGELRVKLGEVGKRKDAKLAKNFVYTQNNRNFGMVQVWVTLFLALLPQLEWLDIPHPELQFRASALPFHTGLLHLRHYRDKRARHLGRDESVKAPCGREGRKP